MTRALSFSLFLAVAIGLIGSTHYYVWTRLVRDAALPQLLHQFGTGALVVLGCSIPAAMALSRLVPAHLSRPWLLVTYCWMGLFFILLSATAGLDLLRAVAWGAKHTLFAAQPDLAPLQRLAVQRGLAAVAALTALVGTGVALHTVRQGPQVRGVAVALKRFPAALDGFTVAQISDLHVAPLLGRAYVEDVVDKVLAQRPSMIVLTGDLVDGSVPQLRDGVAPLARLQAPHGVFFITGNHEYYSGADAWIAELTRLGIRVLRNQRVAVGTGQAGFDLAGIDDFTAAQFGGGHGADLAAALQGRDPTRELLLLAHQPKAIDEAAQYGVGLMLSGHTHGGQIFPFGAIVRLVQPYLKGLYRHGETQIYVNPGTGYWGPPMRLGAPPEITLLTLRRG
jgi:predicted MPP superfamily phosphohydrolase